MMETQNFSVVIVTYNSEMCILDLLDNIKRLDKDVIRRTLVVDNYSSDETVNFIRTHYPKGKIIQNKENIGYGRAVNQAVREIDFDLFFLLNPDIRLPSEFFSEMIRVFDSESIGAIGPLQYKLRGNKKILNFCWSFWRIECFKYFLANKLQLKIVHDSPIPVTYLNAGCLLINKGAFIEVGGFDERNFLYGEEPDLFLKFKRYGYKSFLHPGVEVIHLRDQSINNLPFKELFHVRSKAVFNITASLVRGYSRIFFDRLRNARGRKILPKTKLGNWSFGLIIAMPLLFVIATSFMANLYESVPAGDTVLADIAQRPALAITMLAGVVSGVSAFITGLIALIKIKERALLVFVSTIIGAAPTFYIIGEVISAL